MQNLGLGTINERSLVKRLPFFPHHQLQSHRVEEARQRRDADILGFTFDPIHLFSPQACPRRELALGEAAPAAFGDQDRIDVLYHAHIVLFFAHRCKGEVTAPGSFATYDAKVG